MITDFAVAYELPGYISVTFTAEDGETVWVEVNGKIHNVSQTGTGESQSVSIKVDDASSPVAIALHDVEAKPEPIYTDREYWSRPTLQWQYKIGAVRYLIYLGDRVIKKIRPIANLEFYEWRLRSPLPDGWNELRVEAVDAYGRETTRANWLFQVFTMPVNLESIMAAQTGGNITFTVAH